MIKAFADCILTGEYFSPKKVQETLSFFSPEDQNEKGDINPTTGKPYEDGGAILTHPSHLGKTGKKIAWEEMLSFLLEHHHTLRDCGVQDIDLFLNFFYQDSGGAGWHIEAEDINKLAQLGIGLSIDWYHIKEKESYQD